METQTKQYTPRVVRGRIELWVPHNDREIAFAYPSHGPDNYRNVGKSILDNNQSVANGDYTSSLLHSAYCDDFVLNEPEMKNVRETMKNRWLWVFNRNLWTNEGVYVIQDENAVGRSQELSVKDLEEMLKGGKEINGIRFSQDGKTRFAPKGSYDSGYTTPEKFVKDGFIVASCNQEGAEKLGEVASKFRNQPYIYTVNVEEGQNPEQRVSAVIGDDDGLWFYGSWCGSDRCLAFGVLK